MVDDAMRRVAVVDVAVEIADAEVVAHEAAGAQGSAKQWWRGGAVDDDGIVMRRGRREGDAVKPPRPRRVPGLPGPVARRGRRHAPVLPIPDAQGRAHNQVAECRGPAEEVSTTVAVQAGEGEEAEVARGCRSRRSRRSRHGGGDEVVLDEA